MERDELVKIYRAKKQRIDSKTQKQVAGFQNITEGEFCNWFNKDIFFKGCHYCGTTNERSAELYQMQRTGLRPDATRGGKRGKRLEIDRKDARLPYDNLDNIVWCCYWCNNAKSNFFTEIEFKPIALAIGEALKKIWKEFKANK